MRLELADVAYGYRQPIAVPPNGDIFAEMTRAIFRAPKSCRLYGRFRCDRAARLYMDIQAMGCPLTIIVADGPIEDSFKQIPIDTLDGGEW